MLPFYYLSVTVNAIAGIVLVFFDKRGKSDEPADQETQYPITRNSTFLLLMTLFSGMTAIIKLLSPVGNAAIIIGDFFPAVAGIAACGVFSIRYIETVPSADESFLEKLKAVHSYEYIVGLVCLVAAGTHFLFSGVVVL